MSPSRRIAIITAVLCLAAPFTLTLSAQGTLPDSGAVAAAAGSSSAVSATAPFVSSAEVVPASGFASQLAPVGVTPSRSVVDGVAAAPKHLDTRPLAMANGQPSHSAGLMIVGGAALLAGALIGGRAGGAIMVGGAVIGLVGLWRYLQ